jgi:hypothetical protein
MSITTRKRCLRKFGVLLAFLLTLPCCSCAGAKHKPVFPVQGKVLFKGKPTPKAVVFFHPLTNSEENEPMPRGVVGADGTFQISTYGVKDGAPPGHYTISIVWKSDDKGGDLQDDLLPARYMLPSSSGLTVQVKEGRNELEPFVLK